MKIKWKDEVRGWMDMGICGLAPIYGEDGGNYTKLIFEKNPPRIVKKRIHTVLIRFAAFFQKDIKLIRQQAREITGQRSMNPLPINPDIILVPFRMRKPIGKDDGAVGYFFHSSMDNVIEDRGEIRVILKGGQNYGVLDTLTTARHHIGYAHQIYYHLLQWDLTAFKTYGLCQECADVYNQPITKGDFVALSRNIEELNYKLEQLQK